ncbi:MAG TPA: peptide chain release factor N(5)-glutamine methyltransferase [Elainellaceae cyanobacterium]
MNHNAYIVSGPVLWNWRLAASQQAANFDVPIGELDWLLLELTELDRLSLRLGSFKDYPEIGLKIPLTTLSQLWQQRIENRTPVQYLAGTAPWRRFALAVSPAVLIPRPETEELIDLAIAHVYARAPHLAHGHWADLGTGSGAIAIGLADALSDATIHAVDTSPDALAIARHNAQQMGVGDRIQFYQGDWFHPLDSLRGALSGMVSNPPYIPSGIVPNLQPEVAQHEPHVALDGGQDGLDCIRHLVNAAPDYLISGGLWLIEMMAGQGNAITELLEQTGNYHDIQIHRDLAGLDRYAIATRR